MKKLLFLVLACGMFVSTTAQIDATSKWKITPAATRDIKGNLVFDYSRDLPWTLVIFKQPGKTYIQTIGQAESLTELSLDPGTYLIELNSVPVNDVPIETGKNTTVSYGILNVKGKDHWTIWDQTGKTHYKTVNSGMKMPFPPGTYTIKMGKLNQQVVIKEGETVDVGEMADANAVNSANINTNNISTEALNPEVYQKWVITDMTGINPGPAGNGALDLTFAGSTAWNLKITKDGTNEIVELNADAIKLKTRSHSLAPGKYDIKLNNVPIDNVPIESGKKTRLKAGFITIMYVTANAPALNVKCYVYDRSQGFSSTSFYFMIDAPMKKLVPAGTHGLRVWGDYPFNTVVIQDGQNKEILITTSKLTINANGTSWKLCNTDQSIQPCYFFGGNGTHNYNLPVGIYKLWYGTQSKTVNVNSSGQNTVSVPQ